MSNVLAYLISPRQSASRDADPSPKSTRILLGGWRTYEGDEEHFQFFSRILEKAATFDVLYKKLPFRWGDGEVYDTINPFGDRRDIQYDALWTFDLKNDVLFHTNRRNYSKIKLALLRERGVTMADMESLGPPVPLPLEPTVHSEMPYWKPQVQVDEKLRVFTHRILRDFNHQWRHILRNSYNSLTLRVLARAIIRIATLRFEVREVTERHGIKGSHVWITNLPAWEPFKADIVRVGKIYIVLSLSIQEGLSMAREHLTSQKFTTNENTPTTDSDHMQEYYMILSVKHIVLCCATGPNTIKHTVPEPLLNGNYGIGPPSDLALDYLLWATATARDSISTPLSLLPVEVQDIIQGYMSAGTVAAAKVSCVLGTGSPFSWKDGPLNLELEEFHTHLFRWAPVESHIWFGERKSGLVYRGERLPR